MIAIYIVCGLGIGFSLGMLEAAVLVYRRTKKRQKQLAQLIGARGRGKTGGIYSPYCYLDMELDMEEEEEEEPDYYMMQEGPDEPEDYMEQCYEYELKCKEEEEENTK